MYIHVIKFLIAVGACPVISDVQDHVVHMPDGRFPTQFVAEQLRSVLETADEGGDAGGVTASSHHHQLRIAPTSSHFSGKEEEHDRKGVCRLPL